MAESVAMDVCEANLPNGRTIRNLITANDLCEIRALLNPLTLRHRQSIVCQNVYNKTLLRYACELGFQNIVKYLLDECSADISERYINCYTWLSPLRISINNMDVRMFILLVNRGVLVADICEVIKCAKYVCLNKYFLIFTVLKDYINAMSSKRSVAELPSLLSCLANKHLNNEATLLRVVTSGDLNKIRISLANCKNRKATNESEQNALCIAILNEKRNAEHFLLNYGIFSLKDHVQALELAGATFIVFQSNVEKGLRCWRKALRIRTESFFGVSDKQENKLQTDLGREFTNEEQLDVIKNYDIDVHTQALIVFTRLLSPCHVLYGAFKIVLDHPAIYRHFVKVIKILAAYFQLPSLTNDKDTSTAWTMNRLDILIFRHFESDPLNIDDSFAKFKYLNHCINEIDWNYLLNRQGNFYEIVYKRLLKRVLHKLVYLNDCNLRGDDLICIKDGISRILQQHSDPYPTTLLHLSIEEPFAHRIIPFIIRCMGDANCRDKLKNTPIHCASLLPTSSINYVHLIDWLVDLGGHIDAANEFGITPFMILKSKGVI